MKSHNLPAKKIRVDYISGRFTIVHAGDGAGTGPDSAYVSGNEEQTNPSVLSLVIRDGILHRMQDADGEFVKGWVVRVFEPSSPIMSASSESKYEAAPFESQPAYGRHYVVAASPDPQEALATITTDQWSNVLVVVQDRVRWLYGQKGVSYVGIYADHDGELKGGAKIHPHLNIVTFGMIPPAIKREMESYKRSQSRHGKCPMCIMLEDAGADSRRIMQTEYFVAYCPWSPSYPLEFCIAPRRHSTSFAKISQKEIEDLATITRATLGGLTSIAKDVSYSMVLHLSAEHTTSFQIHWHIEVYPATKKWSGMERGYGIHINDIPPEDAARRLKAACIKEFAEMMGVK